MTPTTSKQKTAATATIRQPATAGTASAAINTTTVETTADTEAMNLNIISFLVSSSAAAFDIKNYTLIFSLCKLCAK